MMEVYYVLLIVEKKLGNLVLNTAVGMDDIHTNIQKHQKKLVYHYACYLRNPWMRELCHLTRGKQM